MATIKTDRIDFEKLLNGLDPIAVQQPDASSVAQKQSVVQSTGVQQQTVSVDNASASDLMTVKLFEFDYDAIRKGLRKKARKTILGMVTHIIPDDIISEDYIQDKIEQDIETMTELYMQVESNKIMQRSLITSVSTGNQAPRMYEVFGQMSDKISAFNKQIVDTEQRIRKTYVDLKYEVRDKESEMCAVGMTMIENGNSNQIGIPGGTVVSSTKNLIENAKKKHIEQMKNAKETTFEES